jgi:hypothetical protein
MAEQELASGVADANVHYPCLRGFMLTKRCLHVAALIYEVINIWSFCFNRDVRGQGY